MIDFKKLHNEIKDLRKKAAWIEARLKVSKYKLQQGYSPNDLFLFGEVQFKNFYNDIIKVYKKQLNELYKELELKNTEYKRLIKENK